MTVLDASYFKRGDVVVVRWCEFWTHGRVIGCAESSDYREHKRLFELYKEGLFEKAFSNPPDESLKYGVRVALNQPFDASTIWRFRFFETGMPVYREFTPDHVRLEAHDPDWNPFDVGPYAAAEVHRDFGTYLTGDYYQIHDPVWVWEENDWRAAIVVHVGRWISVRYLNNFRDRRGNRSKSYRTWQIWPVASESSPVFRKRVEGFSVARESYKSQSRIDQ